MSSSDSKKPTRSAGNGTDDEGNHGGPSRSQPEATSPVLSGILRPRPMPRAAHAANAPTTTQGRRASKSIPLSLDTAMDPPTAGSTGLSFVVRSPILTTVGDAFASSTSVHRRRMSVAGTRQQPGEGPTSLQPPTELDNAAPRGVAESSNRRISTNKYRKSDTEVDSEDSTHAHGDAEADTPLIALPPKPKRKKPRAGLIPTDHALSTPPPASLLFPLPQDPNHLLPLSSRSSPVQHHRSFPGESPPISADEIKSPGFEGSGAGGSSSSPRTSASSSQPWGARRWYSDSSAGDDSDPQTTSFWRHHAKPLLKSNRSNGPRFFTGTRRWSWLLAPFHEVLPPNFPGASGKRRRKRKEPITVLGKLASYIYRQRWIVTLGMVSFVLMVFLITITIKHILNPDKVAVPFRRYCSPDEPTLFSLNPNWTEGRWSHITTTVTKRKPMLLPIDPTHRLWPYPGHSLSPHREDVTGSRIDNLEPVSALLGVMTVDEAIARRNLIRQSYASHWRSRKPGSEQIRVRFVMGRPSPKYAHAVAMEMETFNDIVFLDTQENMNDGKTHAFFSWAAQNATVPDYEYPSHPRSAASTAQFEVLRSEGKLAPIYRGEKKPDYILKADDDAFVMLGELERHLRAAPRTKAMWGYLISDVFMAGECYGMSYDLAEYLSADTRLLDYTHGKEDKLVSKWMRMHPQASDIIWVSERCWIYDHPRAGTVYSHGYLFPNEVDRIRIDREVGLDPEVIEARGGKLADSYSTVSVFGKQYRPPVQGLSSYEEVEALVEGSELSKLRDKLATPGEAFGFSARRPSRESFADIINQLMSTHPTRKERFLGDEQERGGTVVVHYIKKAEWFAETMAALLQAKGESKDTPQAEWGKQGNGRREGDAKTPQ